MELTEIAGGTATASTRADKAGALGQQDFLRMLIAQLENQDPLDPQDATEFTAQLAQFSSLDQLVAMRTSIDSLTANEQSTQLITGAGLIGREVLVPSAAFTVGTDPAEPPPELLVDFEEPAARLSVQIRDSQNQIVASATFTGLDAGLNELAWSDFSAVPGPGTYTVELLPDGGAELPTLLTRARVTGSALDSGAASLRLGEVTVRMADVREVSQ